MKLRTSVRRPVLVATAAVAVAGLAFGGQAAADAFITGKDVKNNSLSGADIKNNSISWADIKNNSIRSTEIRNGSIELRDMSEEALEELIEGILGVLEHIGVFEALDNLEDADAATQAEIDAIKAAAEALAERVTAAEGTIGELQTAVSALEESLAALEGTVAGLSEAVAELQGALDALETRLSAVEAAALVSSNWGDILRNVLGAASTELRNGPYAANFGLDAAPPAGTGSLQISVADRQSKTVFGNEVDFVGDAVSEIGSPSFWVYTTGENHGRGANNLPNITLEIDPDVDGANGRAINYTSMVFVPQGPGNLGGWTQYTATDGQWFFTGGAGTATGCKLATMCSFDDAMDALGADATIHSIGVGKGRDLEFHGAVDALQIGGVTYDFEARGVVAVEAAAE